MEFNLVEIVITVQSDNVVGLQRCLSTLGREFSEVTRGVVCRWLSRNCDSCSVRENCNWHLVFGQKLTADPSALKRHQKPPLPFIFSFPVLESTAEKLDLLDCGLVMVGRAIHHLDLLLEGFAELLAGDTCTVPAEVIRISSRDYQGNVQALSNGSSITRPEELAVLSAEGLLHVRPWEGTNLGIRLQSPLRLFGDGRLLARFDFSRFARSVMRRVSSLAYYYGECEFDVDFKELSRQADSIICADDHFCQSTGGNGRISGITGYGNFCGDFSGLMPFLVLGMYVHVGKGAAFGMGRYELKFD